MGKLQKVLIMAGGTGGHIFPGLAVAKRLQAENIEVIWLGTQKGLEAKLVPAAGLPIHYISISGLRGKGAKDLLLAPWRLFLAILQSIKIIRQVQPDVVIGMGGFASGPGGIASWLLRCPLVIHEQNAKPGLTNKYLSYLAKKVLEGFPKTFKPQDKVVLVGNPVRQEIIQASLNKVPLKNRPLHLLVLGGSLGASAINQIVPQVLAKIPVTMRPLVYHQAGEKHWDETVKLYQTLGVAADVKAFITEMDKAYAWADIVLCRAGASTVAELCAAGLGAIFIPFPHAADDHQTANANFMVQQQAGYLIQQADLTEDKLVNLLKELIASPDICLAMGRAAFQLRETNAAEKVFMNCKEICH